MLQPKINKSTQNTCITMIIFSQIKVFLRYLISKYFFGREWNRDRLTGLIKYCKKNLSTTFKIDIIDLGLGVNPVNPSTLIILTRKK